MRGVDNVKDENDAIKTIMYLTKQPRSNFMVHGLIKKGEFDKTKGEIDQIFAELLKVVGK